MRLVNLVGTMCRDGNLQALRAWYDDHVHQLFGCAGLLEARMYLREGASTHGEAPQCLCLYDFASAAAFAEYETGPVRAAAAADRERSWGREGIAITLRHPLTRIYRRTLAGEAPTRWLVRALAAGAQAHRGIVAGIDGAVDLYLTGGADHSTLVFSTPHAASAPPAQVSVTWQADYAAVRHWTR